MKTREVQLKSVYQALKFLRSSLQREETHTGVPKKVGRHDVLFHAVSQGNNRIATFQFLDHPHIAQLVARRIVSPYGAKEKKEAKNGTVFIAVVSHLLMPARGNPTDSIYGTRVKRLDSGRLELALAETQPSVHRGKFIIVHPGEGDWLTVGRTSASALNRVLKAHNRIARTHNKIATVHN